MMAAGMGAFGERLQREREMRGITLEQMSEATKITTRCLRALEEEEFDRLPGGIFNKGFVRAYARHLGIDEDQAIADFVAASGGEKEQPLPDPPVARSVVLGQHAEGNVNWRSLGVLGLVLAALAAVAWKVGPAAWHGVYGELTARLSSASAATEKAAEAASPTPKPAPVSKPNTPAPQGAPAPQSTAPAPVPAAQTAAEVHAAPPQPPASQRVEEAAAQPPPPAPAAEKPAPPKPEPVAVAAKTPPAAPPSPAVAPAPAQSRPFVVHVRATQDAWVQIVADGKLVSEGVLVPPAEKRVPAAKEVVIKTGNAAGVEVSFNGQPLPSLGEENQMATVTFTAAGLRR